MTAKWRDLTCPQCGVSTGVLTEDDRAAGWCSGNGTHSPRRMQEFPVQPSVTGKGATVGRGNNQ